MDYLRRINVWFLLFGLFVAKAWGAIDEGNIAPWLLIVMAGFSLLAILHVEKDAAKRILAWQGGVYFFYILFTLGALALFGLKEKDWVFLQSLLPYKLWPTFLIDAFGAAALEEILFRKMLLGSLLKKTSRAKAIIFSSVLFYLVHLSIMVTILVSGIFYASIALRCRSLLLAIGIHTLYDFLGNMARAVEHVPNNISIGLNPYQVLHGGDVLAHFAFIILYFSAIFLFDVVVSIINKTRYRRNFGEIAQ